MIRPIYVAGVIALAVAFAWGVYTNNYQTVSNDTVVQTVETAEVYAGKTHALRHYDSDRFFDGIVFAKERNPEASYPISGGITPHHLYPGFILADFYMRIGKQNPKTMLVIGPNHAEKGNFPIITSSYGWETPFGVVAPDTPTIERLLRSGFVRVNEDVLPEDHAVAGQMPFIKFFAPQTRVIPVLVSGTLSEEDAQQFAATMHKLLPPDTVVVAAVDFSHYLNAEEAQRNDGITLETMKTFNYDQLFKMNNDFIDSPTSIGIVLMLMKLRNTVVFDTLYNTNSGLLQHNNTIQTTSYFSILFH